ncbi:MAG TPA: methylated-DNA--[protein]-cysteine S-methyltransferase [Bdellovibrionota bacterium]|jgi:methylated-DNA-[protein]-cysteine S-methyltransferase|nr:methylated-DNA--[protein]-cysteine S-methyltransferase [Bdellovibrionota bacterium]
MKYVYRKMKSPVGELTLVANERGLAAVLWQDDRPGRVRLGGLGEDRDHPLLIEAEKQLRQYFGGERQSFSLELAPEGTEFQQEVWLALRKIPYGETRSYGELAKVIGRPSASRAVGAANGRNPLSIVVPCHRVIGAGGQLTGFAGGLECKSILLNLEAQRLAKI